MYSDKVVVAVKVNGRVLREDGGMVTLPFGCEYSILLKNLNSVRAQFSVSVDGQDATGGSRLIVAPNSSLELERFIRNGNLHIGNRFKFIERTTEIEQHRGVGADDGLIRVETWRERVQRFVDVPVPRYYDDPIPVPRPWYPPYPYPRRPRPPYWGRIRGGQPAMKGPSARTTTRSIMPSSFNVGSMAASPSAAISDAGITVSGSHSNQQFYTARDFPVEPQSTVLVLHLRGDVGGAPVAAPVTVDVKLTCSTCGKTSESSNQFCPRCGTALSIV